MIRRNILTDDEARQDFVEGVHLLKQRPWTDGLGIYDFFVYWHHQAMMTPTPEPPVPNGSRRNAAHSGPVFLPWHRYMLLAFEFQLRDVLGKDDFRLPYWDSAADAEDPLASRLWTSDGVGGTGDPVGSGPFQRFAADGRQWEVRLAQNPNTGRLERTARPLSRDLGREGFIPGRDAFFSALELSVYDSFPWDDRASGGFRNRLEGLHNFVHVWVGRDMATATSPNDPVFFLHHCNVDRLWRSWQEIHGTDLYLPAADAPEWLARHRREDRMFSFFEGTVTPETMLDADAFYVYDALEV